MMLVQKRPAAIGFIFVTILIDVIGFGIIIPVRPKLIRTLINGTLSDAAKYGGWQGTRHSYLKSTCNGKTFRRIQRVTGKDERGDLE